MSNAIRNLRTMLEEAYEPVLYARDVTRLRIALTAYMKFVEEEPRLEEWLASTRRRARYFEAEASTDAPWGPVHPDDDAGRTALGLAWVTWLVREDPTVTVPRLENEYLAEYDPLGYFSEIDVIEHFKNRHAGTLHYAVATTLKTGTEGGPPTQAGGVQLHIHADGRSVTITGRDQEAIGTTKHKYLRLLAICRTRGINNGVAPLGKDAGTFNTYARTLEPIINRWYGYEASRRTIRNVRGKGYELDVDPNTIDIEDEGAAEEEAKQRAKEAPSHGCVPSTPQQRPSKDPAKARRR